MIGHYEESLEVVARRELRAAARAYAAAYLTHSNATKEEEALADAAKNFAVALEPPRKTRKRRAG